MSNQLDQECDLPLGTRDAIHVPYVVGTISKDLSLKERMLILPGCWVRFIDDKFIKFVPCEKAEAHGMVNPFLDKISRYSDVVVLLIPGITSQVTHQFDIDPSLRDQRQAMLEAELAEVKEQDPGCADCWVIRNNCVVRM
jgi:hypothetical protein